MGWIQSLAIILIIVIVFFTAITEPQLSFKYFKACGESVTKLVIKTKDLFKSSSQKDTGGNNNDLS